MRFPFSLRFFKKSIFTLTFLLAVLRCADDELMIEPTSPLSINSLDATTTSATRLLDCSSCDYVVPEGQHIVDGAALGLKPGSVIGLNGNNDYGHLIFRNIVGTPDNPIIIKNCGGAVFLDGTGKPNTLKTEYSKNFRITGGDIDGYYGIRITGAQMGISLGTLTTDVEVDHVEVMNSGFAGIMAKTDPTCDDATIRANFLMENVNIHHNYIHDTAGEGIYAGNSFFMGMERECGLRLPHEIHYITIHHNILKNTGWEAIQLGCATIGASIHDNRVENYGVANKPSQRNGIQISAGTGGLCYNNLIKKGTGNGMMVGGLGDNIIFNNIIDQAGNFGIFCDERASTGSGFKFINNTIINSQAEGLRIYAELLPMNVFVNNIIANPGNGVFVQKLSDNVKMEMANNYFTTQIDSLKILDVARSIYTMEGSSPVVDKGADISAYSDIIVDYYNNPRLNGPRYDIGAIEATTDGETTPNKAPVADAGPNQSFALPKNSTQLYGRGTDTDGTIVSYRWIQYGGTPTIITDAQSPTATVSGLVEGKYYFTLTVKDDRGLTHSDNVLVRVQANAEPVTNAQPVADAGPNQTLVLPQNATTLNGSANDSDGSITGYQWTQYGGPVAIISNANSATATVSGLAAGRYYFRLTVTDDDGATHYDNMLVKVEEPLDGADAEPLPESNGAPRAFAGVNQLLTAPVASTILYGTATDDDGRIESVNWTQYGGPSVDIDNANTPTATVSGLSVGKYYFKFTVEDDDGMRDSDNVLIRVVESSEI